MVVQRMVESKVGDDLASMIDGTHPPFVLELKVSLHRNWTYQWHQYKLETMENSFGKNGSSTS